MSRLVDFGRFKHFSNSLSNRDNDGNDRKEKLYYFLDTEIIFYYTDVSRAVDDRRYTGFAQLFSTTGLENKQKKDAKKCTLIFGKSLIEYIFNLNDCELNNKQAFERKPYFIITPEVKYELLTVLNAIKNNILSPNDGMYDQITDIEHRIEKECEDAQGEPNQENVARKLVDLANDITVELKNIKSKNSELSKFLEINDQLKSLSFFKDKLRITLEDDNDIYNKWSDRFNENITLKDKDKDKDKDKEEIKIENDISLLTNIESINDYFKAKGLSSKALLITHAKRILDLTKDDSLNGFIRTPLSFIADKNFLLKTEETFGQSGMHALTAIVDTITKGLSQKKTTSTNLNQASVSWNKFLLSRINTKSMQFTGFYEICLNEKLSADDAKKTLHYIKKIQQEYQTEAIKSFEMFAQIGIGTLSNYYEPSTANFPYRSPPPIIFGSSFEIENDFIKKITDRVDTNHAFEILEKHKNDFIKNTGSSYSYFICYSLTYASIGEWKTAYQLSKFALSLLNVMTIEKQEKHFITGREAKYLIIHSKRNSSLTKNELENLDKLTGEYLIDLKNDRSFLDDNPRNKFNLLEYRLQSEVLASYTKVFLMRVINDGQTYYPQLENRLRALTDLIDDINEVQTKTSNLQQIKISLLRKTLTNLFTLLLFKDYTKCLESPLVSPSIENRYVGYIDIFQNTLSPETSQPSQLAVNTFWAVNSTFNCSKFDNNITPPFDIDYNECSSEYSKERFRFLDRIIKNTSN